MAESRRKAAPTTSPRNSGSSLVTCHSSHPRASARGFTILELLVAIGITLALAGVMLSVTTGTLNVWRRVQGNFSSSSQAKLVLDLLERDLQSALHRTDTNKWLAVELPHKAQHGWLALTNTAGTGKPNTDVSLIAVPDAPASGAPPAIADARFGYCGAWLRFFTPDSTGQPIAVSYQIVRTSTDAATVTPPKNPAHYFLFRGTADATNTFKNGYDLTAATYSPFLDTPAIGDVLADNVVDFGVWFYVRTTNPATGVVVLTRIFPTSKTDQARYVATGTAATTQFPEVADVMVRILTEEGAALLGNIEQGNLTVMPQQFTNKDDWWWAVAVEHSQVYVRRIEIKGGVL